MSVENHLNPLFSFQVFVQSSLIKNLIKFEFNLSILINCLDLCCCIMFMYIVFYCIVMYCISIVVKEKVKTC